MAPALVILARSNANARPQMMMLTACTVTAAADVQPV
jgi:hypothetical protein